MLTTSLAGCASTSAETPEAVQLESKVIQSLSRYKKEYVLSPGDQIEVNVYRHPELSTTGIVRADGFISVPVLDDISVAGLTVPEVDERITDMFRGRLVKPEVTIIVKNAREPVVYVVGDVARPQPVPLREARTAAQAIARVSGVKRTAGTDRIAIIRMNDDGYLVAHVVQSASGDEARLYMALSAMPLEPDDIVVVPESKRSRFVRFIQDYINVPMTGINQVLTPYFQFEVLIEID